MDFISFIPATESYVLYYPKDYYIEESEDNIVSIIPNIDADNNETMTISSFTSDSIVTYEDLHYFIKKWVKDYTEVESPKTIMTENGICIRGIYKKNSINWIWVYKALENKIIMITIHSKEEFDEKILHLYSFMIDKLKILTKSRENKE